MAESQTTSDYPGSLDTWTSLTDKEDLAEVSDILKMKAAIQAIQGELGLNPAGSLSTLVARLAIMMEDNGALNQGTSYPSAVDGQIFYRTDLNTAAIYNGSGWDVLGQSLSNVIYCWHGCEDYSSGSYGSYNGTSLAESSSSPTVNYNYLLVRGGTFQTVLRFKYIHTAGITDVEVHARIWANTDETSCRVTIGGQAGTVTRTSTTPGWATKTDITLSGLSAGTTYDGTVEIKNDSNPTIGNSFLSSIIIISK